jgi:hypothetical protein
MNYLNSSMTHLTGLPQNIKSHILLPFDQEKSGGLVVWTKGDIHFVANIQKVPMLKCTIPEPQRTYGSISGSLSNGNGGAHGAFREIDQSIGVHTYEAPIEGTLYEREVNRLLDSLGPRFIDWWWNTPLPVDADLLPQVVPGYKTPFRQCPPGVRPTLADGELTYLRRLAHPLPTHFALGEYGINSHILLMFFK